MAKKAEVKGLEKELFSDRERMEIWFSDNWKKSLIAAAVIIVAVVAVYAVKHYREVSRHTATAELAGAKTEELPAMLEKYPDSPGAVIARMRLADDLISKKDYAGAKEQFKLISRDKNAPAEIRGRAGISAAACDELAGSIKDASEAFLVIMNDVSAGLSVREEAGFQAGRLLVSLKEYDRAGEVFSTVCNLPGDGGSNYRQMAGFMLKSLKNGDLK